MALSLWSPMNPPLADWRGRSAWIVGASTGIGRAVAARLAAQGACVTVSARDQAALVAFTAEYPGSRALSLDVTDAAAVAQAATRIAAGGGLPDLVLCCAGTYQPMRSDQFDLAVATRHVQVNQLGVLHVLAAVLPGLIARGQGHVSLVSSVAGWQGLPLALAYGPTKAAVQQLAEILYQDLRPRGLGVSVVNPGFVETPLTAGNTFRMPALITPDEAARSMLAGWARGHFDIHFPRRFSGTLKMVALLPPRLRFALIRRATQA